MGSLLLLFCGLGVLFAVLAEKIGSSKGFLTFIVLGMLAYIMPYDGIGLLLIAALLLVLFGGTKAEFLADGWRDYSINYGAALFLMYYFISYLLSEWVFWQMYLRF